MLIGKDPFLKGKRRHIYLLSNGAKKLPSKEIDGGSIVTINSHPRIRNPLTLGAPVPATVSAITGKGLGNLSFNKVKSHAQKKIQITL